MKPTFVLGAFALLLTACSAPTPTLTDDQVVARIHTWRQISDCNDRGYFTSREFTVVQANHPVSLYGQDQTRVNTLAQQHPTSPRLSNQQCSTLQREAAADIRRIDQQNSTTSSTSTICIPISAAGHVYCS